MRLGLLSRLPVKFFSNEKPSLHEAHHMNQPSPLSHPRDPLHGITLEAIVSQLVTRHGWAEMGRRIPVRCFMLGLAAVAWSGAYLLFAVVYGPFLIRPSTDG